MAAHPPLSNVPLPPGSYPCSALREPVLQAIKREMLAARGGRGGGGYSAFRRAPRPWEELRKPAAQEDQYWGSDASLSSSLLSPVSSCTTASSKAFTTQSQSMAAAHAQIKQEREEIQEETEKEDEDEDDDDEEEDEEEDWQETFEPCCSRGRAFPPAISSPAFLSLASSPQSLPPRLHTPVSLRAVREDGRLVLRQEACDTSPQRYLRASREQGRLRLHLCIAEEPRDPFQEDEQEENGPLQQLEVQQLEHESEGELFSIAHQSVLEAHVSYHDPCTPHEVPQPPHPITYSEDGSINDHVLMQCSIPYTPPEGPPFTDGLAAIDGQPGGTALDSLLKAKFHHHHHTMASFLHKSLTRVRPLVC